MAQSSVMVSLPQMVDLALNCPEVGAVNFNVLHSLLHVLIQQVDLLDCKVEFKGDDSERIQSLIAASKPGPTLNLTEYIVSPGKEQQKVITKKNVYKKIKKKEKSSSDPESAKKHSKEEVIVEKELKVIEPRKDSKQEPVHSPSPMSSYTNLGSSTSLQTVVVVEPVDGTATPHVSVALSRGNFNDMQGQIDKLQDEVKELKELPANMGLIDALRNASVDKSSPVLDMFQILTLAKRIDATETGLSKLASMLEDLAREHRAPELVKKASDLQVEIQASKVSLSGEVKERIEDLEKRMRRLEEGGTETSDTGTSGAFAAGGADAKRGGADAKRGSADGPAGGVPFTDNAAMQDLLIQVAKISERMEIEDSPDGRVNTIEVKLSDFTNTLATMDAFYSEQLNQLQSQFSELEKEIGEIVERINAGFPGGDMSNEQQGMSELFKKIMGLQQDMENVAITATKLMEDREERQAHMDAMLEQIELLKTIKADREDLEDALADKADTCAVNRKVSHDQFDAACDDLSRGIEDALSKLTQQEQLWQQALDDIQKEIESKLDKMELTPLRDFIHNKLKMLQDRLKALAALKKESEAAGTKSKFLRNVSCISCDQDVIMRKRMHPSLLPPPTALPPTKSMGPYLAYELDALRKQQKCAPHARNMNHFESAMAGAASKKGDDHICNRYCGGSHTVTTPQQRVTRLGHFLQQWGPETQPVHEGQIRGTDGQFYKSREGGDITPRDAPPEGDEIAETEEDHFPSTRSRPSMVVQGGIITSRSAMKGAVSKENAERRSSGAKSAEQRPSQALSQGSEKRLSTSSQQRKASGSQRGSLSAGPRASAELSSKHPSQASAGRGSLQKTSRAPSTQQIVSKEEPSHISFKSPEGGEEEQPAAVDAAPSAEPEAAPAEPSAEAESMPPAEGGEEAVQEGEGEAPTETAAPEDESPPE